MQKNKKPKVAFILSSLTSGGAERVLLTLMNHLDPARFDPTLITVNENGPLRDLLVPRIPFYPLGCAHVVRCLPRLYAALKQIRPDIVVSTMAPMNFAVLLLRPFFPRTRFIVREAVVPSSLSGGFKGFLIKTAYRCLYPAADMVISPSRCIIDEFTAFLKIPASRHALLYNPVDSQRTAPLPDEETEAKTVRFVCAGRLHRQKGFDRLIEALPDLNHACDWTVTIYGEGAERDNLTALIRRYGLENRVTLAGLSRNPCPHIAAADAFLLPSRWEGLPNVVLESLDVGTPVIAMAEAGGIAEIADLAAPGAVTVTADMTNFVAAMRQVGPSHKPRPSLLPSAFTLDMVMDRFMSLLEDVREPASGGAPAAQQKNSLPA